MSNTPVASIAEIVASVRSAYSKGISKNYEWRRTQLKGISRFVKENKAEIYEALKKDLGRHPQESEMGESMAVNAGIKDMLKNMSTWVQPRGVATPLFQMKGMTTSQIVPEPKGVVLIISPWNYPINLPLIGVATALCAGNCVILKPSEVSEHCSRLLMEKLPGYLDAECIRLVAGAIPETTELLKHRFDHILYTGNGTVGRIVMRAAAEHLTPVTLELGGKSPVIIDKDVEVDIAARRIVWGKCMNAGQTCISPDYVLVHKDIQAQMVDALKRIVEEFYGPNPKESPSMARIINNRQWTRLTDLLNQEKAANANVVVAGGETDKDTNYIAPTILYPASLEGPMMRDEIFGPILPVLPVDDVDQAIRIINERPKPLALYIFTKNSSVWQNVIDNTSSGGLVVNDTLVHYTVPGLPFGGVGESGVGAYHGITGFDTFSHLKAVVNKTTWFDLNVRYPPYSEKKLATLDKLSFMT